MRSMPPYQTNTSHADRSLAAVCQFMRAGDEQHAEPDQRDHRDVEADATRCVSQSQADAGEHQQP